MADLMIWGISGIVSAGTVGFFAGWKVGRRVLKKRLAKKSTAECFLKLLNY